MIPLINTAIAVPVAAVIRLLVVVAEAVNDPPMLAPVVKVVLSRPCAQNAAEVTVAVPAPNTEKPPLPDVADIPVSV